MERRVGAAIAGGGLIVAAGLWVLQAGLAIAGGVAARVAGRVAAAFAALVLLGGVLAWCILVLQVVVWHSGGYCEDYAACFEAKPGPLAIQGTFALVGVTAAIGLAIRCISYARGRGPADMRMVRRALVVVFALAAWIVYVVALTTLY